MKIPEQERSGGGRAVEGDRLLALSERFLDRAKKTCLLCRRQFASVEVLEKHATMSGLHKVGGSPPMSSLTNTFHASDQPVNTARSATGLHSPTTNHIFYNSSDYRPVINCPATSRGQLHRARRHWGSTAGQLRGREDPVPRPCQGATDAAWLRPHW